MNEKILDNKSGLFKFGFYLLGFASIFVILFGIREMAVVINPIILAVVITLCVIPIHTFLMKKGFSDWISIFITILLVIGILGTVIFVVFISITKLSVEIPTYLAQISAQINNDWSRDIVDTLGININSIYGLMPYAERIISIIISFITQFGITLLIFVFMIVAAVGLKRNGQNDLNIDSSITTKIISITKDVRKYVNTLTFINLLVAIGNIILLMFLGIPYAFLWGILSWFMGYIPAVGFVIALIPPAILGYLMYGPTVAIIIIIGYILINGGVQNLLQPKIMGDNLNISPVVVFISIFFWGYLLGGIGVLLCIPLTLIIILILENIENTKWIAQIMRYNGSNSQKKEKQKAIKKAKRMAEKINPFGK